MFANMKATIITVALLGTLLTGHATAQTSGSLLLGLLPQREIEAEVLELWTPPRLAEITARLQRAIQADPAWWRSHSQQAQPGQPVPYDARMGITQDEYTSMLAMADSMQMRPRATFRLRLQTTPTGWRFPTDAAIPALASVEIDTVADVVRTPFGALPARGAIQPSAAQKATGPWGGPQWKTDALAPGTTSGTIGAFAVGRLEASGQTLVYFDAREIADGKVTGRSTTMLRLPKP